MKDLCCMSYLGKDNAVIIVAGCQNTMFKIDVDKGRILEEVERDQTSVEYIFLLIGS